ncbi:MAG: TetR/AcrR family transcriptional regulator C-terminal domain-containing protein [Clostridia bacterium]|nr:TetR/AcrR family transcriptional regulator C-terminal domain-containing protein [Clostridia bacterium]
MPNFTKREIKASFLRLLQQKKLADITVKDIVNECCINRGSFYYHFQDIPALIEEIIQENTEEIVNKYSDTDSASQCLEALMEIIINNKKPILNVYRSFSRDILEGQISKMCRQFVISYVKVALNHENFSDEDKNHMIQYFIYLIYGFSIDWLDSGLKEEKAQEFKRIFEFQNTIFQDAIYKLKEKNKSLF